MRHLLIEQLHQQELYVPNDISLGKGENGILLFGTNAVGKSSLIKGLGICVILAPLLARLYRLSLAFEQLTI